MRSKRPFPAFPVVLWFLELSRMGLWMEELWLLPSNVPYTAEMELPVFEKTTWPSYGWRMS